jgi:hypothetical protein
MRVLLLLFVLGACSAQPSLDDTNRYAMVLVG